MNNRRILLALASLSIFCQALFAQSPTPGENVNMVSGTQVVGGDPFLQRQNEPSLAVSTRNPQHLLAGANDYRSVDLPYPDVSSDDDITCPGQKCAEPWVGVFKSRDGGESWQSVLLPGFPQDQSPEGLASPLKGFSTASDPVVRAGTNGLFYYSGIAFQRGTNNGVVFVSRFVDLNDKENGDVTQGRDAIRYVNTVSVSSGTTSQFLDKPWIAVDIPRNSRMCTINVPQQGSTVTQRIPAGDVYVAWTAVINPQPNVFYSRIYLSRSTDCGATWTRPVWVSRGYAKSQGAVIQIDPETGIVYVAWRVFQVGAQSDAIVVAASVDGGLTFGPRVNDDSRASGDGAFGDDRGRWDDRDEGFGDERVRTGLQVVSLPPFNTANPATPSFFDQGTTGDSFRTNAYPALAVGDGGFPFVAGPLYVAWAQRGIAPYPTDSRVMVLTINPDYLFNGPRSALPMPTPVENGELTDEFGQPLLTDSGVELSRGHQFMPEMTVSAGKLSVIYYDQREDHTTGSFLPNTPFLADPLGRFYLETRKQQGELLGSPDAVFTPFLTDAGLDIRRHTIDLRVAQAKVTWAKPAFVYSNVTQYRFGTIGTETGVIQTLQQLQVNPPNLPLFQQGTAPFIGDYTDVAGLTFSEPQSGGRWRFNTLPSDNPVQYATWTSNQDVRAPADGDWTHYTPVSLNGKTSSFYDPGQPVPTCIPGQAGMRNQNIYSSQITQGLLLASPQNAKPLSATLQRAFVVTAQNLTSLERSFRVTISAPAGVYASFLQAGNPPPNPPPAALQSLDVSIPPHSGTARSVFAFLTTSSNSGATISIQAVEITTPPGGISSQPCSSCVVVPNGLSGFVLLNPEGVALPLVDPDGTTTGITNIEIYAASLSTPNPSNPNPSNPNPSNPNPSNPNPSNPNPSNPNPSNPNPSNVDIANLSVANPNPSNPNPSNTTPSSSAIINPDLANPNPSNPNPSNPNPSNTNLSDSPVSDATYTVTNTGDTTASYQVVLVGQNPGHNTQLIVSKFYETPDVSANADGSPGCQLITQAQVHVESNVINPVVNPNPSNATPSDGGNTDGSDTNASFQLAPGENAYITLRGFNVSNDPSVWVQMVGGTAPVVVSHAVNTNTNTRTMTVPGGLFILTNSLSDGVTGNSYSQTLQAIGGTQPYTWTIDDPSDVPSGFSLNAVTGVLMFVPGSATPATGTYTFTVRATDASAKTTPKILTLRLAKPLQTPGQVPAASAGNNYTVNLTQLTTGGISPLHWRLTSVSPNTPAWLSLSDSGVLSGTAPASAGAYQVIAQVTDSSMPAQVATASFAVQDIVGTPPPIPHFGQVIDPLGDAGRGNPDLVWASVSTDTAGNVTLKVRFASGTFNPATTAAQFLLDTDQAPATGSPGSSSDCLQDAATMGVDYIVELDSQFGNNTAQIFAATGGCDNFSQLGTAPVTIVTDGMDVTLPLSTLNQPATVGTSGPATGGPWNFKVLTFSFVNNAFTSVLDVMPNAGLAPGSTAPSPLPVTPPSGMLLWYPADGYATDVVGHHGTVLIGGIGYVPGEVGQAFSFNGDGSAITITDSGDLTPAALSVDFWFQSGADLTANSPEAPLVVKLAAGDDQAGNAKGYEITYQSGALLFALPGQGQIRKIVSFPTAIAAGAWHFVAATYDSTGQNLYFDGKLVSSGPNFGPIQYLPAPVQLGKVVNSAAAGVPITYSLFGQLDELEIFNRALSGPEIQTLFNAGSAGKVKPPTAQAGSRTVSGTSVTNSYLENGTFVSRPNDLTSRGISAIVPDGSGGFATIAGAGSANGVFTIPNVPTGFYYLVISGSSTINPATGASNARLLWTNASNVDLGSSTFGRPNAVNATGGTVNFSLTDMSPWQTGDDVQVFVPNAGGSFTNFQFANAYAFPPSPAAGSTTYGGVFNWTREPLIDSTQGDNLYVLKMNSIAQGGLTWSYLQNLYVNGSIVQSDNSTTPISGTFTSPAQNAVLHAAANGAAFVQNVNGPSLRIAFTSTGVYVTPPAPYTGITEFSPFLVGLDAHNQEQLVANINAGDIPYADPFPPNWQRIFSFGQEAFQSYTAPGATSSVGLPLPIDSILETTTLPTASAPAAPIVGPVIGFTINGQPLSQPQTNVGTTPTIAWQPVTGATNYRLRIWSLTTDANGHSVLKLVAHFQTATNSVAFPPGVLVGGTTYVALVGAYGMPIDWTTAPNRFALPLGISATASNTFTP